jgi:hypothetical protein
MQNGQFILKSVRAVDRAEQDARCLFAVDKEINHLAVSG